MVYISDKLKAKIITDFYKLDLLLGTALLGILLIIS